MHFICNQNFRSMQTKQQLVIVLPKSMSDISVRIVKDLGSDELVFHISPSEKESIRVEDGNPKYAFIYGTESYLPVSLDDLVWIKADGSYTDLYLTGNRKRKVSFNIAVVEQCLPQSDFVRIHHSYIVNMKHVTAIIGNMLMIGNVELPIGRKYKNEFFRCGIFIGVRKKPEQ